ncbi:hypothetical protein HanRHA438_Chr08g0336371 [Helianthus annuus]|nr:hypothetical protein HanRHA438_Chr08g0336371 [Helianthus annuus]
MVEMAPSSIEFMEYPHGSNSKSQISDFGRMDRMPDSLVMSCTSRVCTLDHELIQVQRKQNKRTIFVVYRTHPSRMLCWINRAFQNEHRAQKLLR